MPERPLRCLNDERPRSAAPDAGVIRIAQKSGRGVLHCSTAIRARSTRRDSAADVGVRSDRRAPAVDDDGIAVS